MPDLEEAYRLYRISKYRHQHRNYDAVDEYIKDKDFVSLDNMVEKTGLYRGSIGHHMSKLKWEKLKIKGKTFYSSASSIASSETSSEIPSKAG